MAKTTRSIDQITLLRLNGNCNHFRTVFFKLEMVYGNAVFGLVKKNDSGPPTTDGVKVAMRIYLKIKLRYLSEKECYIKSWTIKARNRFIKF